MKLSKIKVNNYRLLKCLDLDLEDDLSLVIGKNNCGKTSLLTIMEKFLSDRNPSDLFCYDDFNIDFRKELEEKILITKEEHICHSMGISMKFFIEYNENSSLANISKVMLDLDPDNNTIVLLFEYTITDEEYQKLVNDFNKYKTDQIIKRNSLVKDLTEDKEIALDKQLFCELIKNNCNKYFNLYRKSIAYNKEERKEDENQYIDITNEKALLNSIINLNVIQANRDISNKDSDRCLSFLSSRYYEKKKDKEDSEEIEKFKDVLVETDSSLNGIYEGLFSEIIDKIKTFGGAKTGESFINVISTLQQKNLLKDNTTVTYRHGEDCYLPENYNGLGYLNLFCMIFEIELCINEFRQNNNPHEKPADINILIIEEPEAHTHPQMQYIFIKNIKKLLKDASKGKGKDEKIEIPFQLQTIITSHSSHITSESQFEDIKYFQKLHNQNAVVAKNLKELEAIYGNEHAYFKFLKQYLTLHRAELFFADKAIFIEGDTERILLPAMMKKIDIENREKDKIEDKLPLHSQNISIIEVGSYSHIFEKFFFFIGLKSLVITDIDSEKREQIETKAGVSKESHAKCRVESSDAEITSNHSLKYFFKKKLENYKKEDMKRKEIDFFINLSFEEKILEKDCDNECWNSCEDGQIAIVYQIKEKNTDDVEYHARSFEDAFLHINRPFISKHIENFESLKNKNNIEDSSKDAYCLAEKCITKKPSFAMEILLCSDSDNYADWHIPSYIKEGLLWLKEN